MHHCTRDLQPNNTGVHGDFTLTRPLRESGLLSRNLDTSTCETSDSSFLCIDSEQIKRGADKGRCGEGSVGEERCGERAGARRGGVEKERELDGNEEAEGRRREEAGEEDDRGCKSSCTSNLSREKSQPLRAAAGKQLLANTDIAFRSNEGSRM